MGWWPGEERAAPSQGPERLLQGAQLIFAIHGSERQSVCVFTHLRVCLCVSDGVSVGLLGDDLHSPHKITT